MGKRKLYIHIGMPKTATTALQRFFASNRDKLREMEISFPVISNFSPHNLLQSARAHHRFGWAIEKEEGISDWWFDNDVKNYRQEWNSLNTQFKTDRNLISTETLWGLRKSSIQKIKDLTSHFDVKIVAYIRRQDELDESWYNELVKMGVICSVPSDAFNTIPVQSIFDWEDVFGIENIIVRPYEQKQFYGGSIFSDFMHHVFNIDITDDFILPSRNANTRLHRIVLEYKRLINFLPNTGQYNRKVVGTFQRASEWLVSQNIGDTPMFSVKEKREALDLNYVHYSRIARGYLGRKDGILFTAPLPNLIDNWQPYSELLEEHAKLINEFIACQYPDVMIMIINGIFGSQLSCSMEVRQAAIKLLPGIPSELIYDAIGANLNRNHFSIMTDEISEIYASRTWKVGKVINQLYNKMPTRLKKPALFISKKAYNKL
jgi:hypothetical protein